MRVLLRAEAFRRIAASQNLSLVALGEKLQLETRYMHRLLRGEISPSPTTRERLCRHLEFSFDDLFAIQNDDATK